MPYVRQVFFLQRTQACIRSFRMYRQFLLLFALLILKTSARLAPKVSSVESGENYSSRPLTYKNYGSVLHDNPLVFVKFFTNW